MQVNVIGCCHGCASIDFIRYNTWTHILILSEFAETQEDLTSLVDFIVNILSFDKNKGSQKL